MSSRSRRRIIVTGDWVELFDDERAASIWRIRWAEVDEIVAWKDDVWAYDIICIGLRSGQKQYRCDEEQHGWHDLLRTIERLFAIRRDDWWRRVALPAFETSLTVIWRRGTPSG
ncbi:MAG: hypothetical protein WD403_02250 [Pirellulales bacterium]